MTDPLRKLVSAWLRFEALEQVLIGFSEAGDDYYERMAAGLTWAKHGGKPTPALVDLFSTPYAAARDEGEWTGTDAEAAREALKDIQKADSPEAIDKIVAALGGLNPAEAQANAEAWCRVAGAAIDVLDDIAGRSWDHFEDMEKEFSQIASAAEAGAAKARTMYPPSPSPAGGVQAVGVAAEGRLLLDTPTLPRAIKAFVDSLYEQDRAWMHDTDEGETLIQSPSGRHYFALDYPLLAALNAALSSQAQTTGGVRNAVTEDQSIRAARSWYDALTGRVGAFDDAPPGVQRENILQAKNALTAALTSGAPDAAASPAGEPA